MSDKTATLLSILTLLGILLLVVVVIGYIVFSLIKHLIWYNADCKFRYSQYSQAQRDLDDLEENINRHKDYDWTSEPEQTTKAREPKPGSAAHYEAWRAEQLAKKNQNK